MLITVTVPSPPAALWALWTLEQWANGIAIGNASGHTTQMKSGELRADTDTPIACGESKVV